MENLIDFDPKTAKPYSQVVVPPELGIEHIVRAVGRLGLQQRRNLSRRIDSGSFEGNEMWHQPNYPGPVMHLVRHNQGIIVEIYANGNGSAHQNAWELTRYLATEPSNGEVLNY